ncbi:SDR family oxidoreductase [Lysinibacter cavernae]|uniref:Ribitol 2-dehydrogenase n=1 Tax=Lysinibacter cavernae TaxID=1640652 RepID=A0A7X5R4B5_9MICO|nr:SDR family oxidoreductase [Lysinibacter cavernae]NIH55127.1 ribitol 2-dehydrogenase [Lysinibacter cavernae]
MTTPSSSDKNAPIFHGSVAIVTGASSGLGREYSRMLVANGARVLLVGRSQLRLQALADELGDAVVPLSLDVGAVGAAQQAVDAALAAFGRLDMVLPNAGLYADGQVDEVPEDRLHEIVAANVFGVMALVSASLPLLRVGGGDILVTSSVSGHQTISWEPIYTATKHAVHSYVSAVRQQLAGTNIRVGAVAPGVVLNELWGFAEGGDGVEQLVSDRVAEAGGILSTDVAEAVLFMLSRPRHVTIRDLVILPSGQAI